MPIEKKVEWATCVCLALPPDDLSKQLENSFKIKYYFK